MDKETLNQDQRKAVEYPFDRPLKITAGAGTGKTTVLTLRYIEALRTLRIGPDRVLALTFTNRAADEMRMRIARSATRMGLCREEDFLDADITTFHSFAAKLLRENPVSAGLDPAFGVADDIEAALLFRKAIDKLLRTGYQLEAPSLPVENPEFLYQETHRLIMKLKDTAITPDEFLQEALTKAEAEHEREAAELVYQIYRSYQAILQSSGLLDFSDLVVKACNLLSNDTELASRLRERIRYILVDEFQDTNASQFKLLRLIARDRFMSNVTVVGDDKQAIYAWRNARIENMDDFLADEWGGKTIYLKDNYRSPSPILELAHRSICKEERFLRKSEDIRLRAQSAGSADSPAVTAYLAEDERDEAEFVAETIRALLASGVKPRDIAILFRSVKAGAGPVEEALRARGIPYYTIGGAGLSESIEAGYAIALLRVIHDPYDNQALVKLASSALFGIPQSVLAGAVLEDVRSVLALDGLEVDRIPGLLLFDLLRTQQDEKFQRLVSLIERLRTQASSSGLTRLYAALAEESGLLAWVNSLPFPARDSALANLSSFGELIAEFEESHPLAGLDTLLEYLDVASEMRALNPEAPCTELDACHILTIHQAKGLEFPVVFVCNLKGGRFPLKPRYDKLYYEPGMGLICKEAPGGKNTKRFEARIKPRVILEQEQEERRLFYVAVTRAKTRLFLVSPAAGNGKEFLRELLDDPEAATLLSLAEGTVVQSSERGVLPPGERAADRVGFMFVNRTSVLLPSAAAPRTVCLSFSALKEYMDCPHRYYFARVLGISGRHSGVTGPAHPDGALLGKLVHEAIRRHHIGKGTDPRDDASLAFRAGLSPDVYARYYRADVENLKSLYERSWISTARVLPQDLEVEFHWPQSVNGHLLLVSGFIDMVIRDGERPRIIDFKTNRTISDKDLHYYSHQLRIYGMAWSEMNRGEAMPDLWLYYMRTGEILPVDNSEPALRATVDLIASTAERILEEEFPKNKNDCTRCPFVHLCD
ncbi:MAG: ATP-dependent DNA helicase [Bacillota bacterium]